MIRLASVSKSFDCGESFAVSDLSLDVEEGQTLVLLGSSGCGKTTTLKMINLLLRPTRGMVEVDGHDVTHGDPIELRRRIGYVFQGIGLFPHLTVAHNIEIVPRLLGWDRMRRSRRSAELLELIGLQESYADRFPAELSGGEQQRVGVARALAADPKYLLMDEPFGALDALTRDTLQQELIQLRQRLQKTIVFVTHDLFEALTLGDRIAVLHEGRLQQIGTPEQLVSHPATDFVRDLFGRPAQQLKQYGGML